MLDPTQAIPRFRGVAVRGREKHPSPSQTSFFSRCFMKYPGKQGIIHEW